VSPGVVSLTVANQNLSASEDVNQLYFNLNPAYRATNLIFTATGGSGGFDAPVISLGLNAFKADGDGKYDVMFDFTAGGVDTNRFTANEYTIYQISGIPGLTAADFGYLSQPAGGAGPFYAAAQVQRIGAGSLSGWISATDVNTFPLVPEPGPVSLLGLAAGGWLVFRAIYPRTPAARRTTRTRA
jgi:hypothetical protein